MSCQHEHLAIEGCDQTIGVACTDCLVLLAWCWMDHHVPESLWNRLCEQDSSAIRCEQSRDDVCALCQEVMVRCAECKVECGRDRPMPFEVYACSDICEWMLSCHLDGCDMEETKALADKLRTDPEARLTAMKLAGVRSP